jgi:hypothetical protein
MEGNSHLAFASRYTIAQRTNSNKQYISTWAMAVPIPSILTSVGSSSTAWGPHNHVSVSTHLELENRACRAAESTRLRAATWVLAHRLFVGLKVYSSDG